MIYLDNAATTLHKPPQVEQAILEALHTAGNPGRGAHEPTLHAARIVLDTRLALAELFHVPDPSCIFFAANAPNADTITVQQAVETLTAEYRATMSSQRYASIILFCVRCTGCGHRG